MVCGAIAKRRNYIRWNDELAVCQSNLLPAFDAAGHKVIKTTARTRNPATLFLLALLPLPRDAAA
jgi:hypothetical protein